ncbi:RNA polymerase sigma factor [Ekhidna sp.]|uniref:RNA polymerase sigma factor n=1 Tax=Ekhidna sp. TaxID=2608089 RepID=UPI003298DDDE
MKEADFRDIVNENQDRVYNTCLGFMKNAVEAQDMAQEVFIHVYQNIAKFKGDSKLSTWIYRITTNKCLEEIRRKGRKKRSAQLSDISDEAIQNQAPDFFHPGVAMEDKERAAILFEAIEKLPDPQRVAFTLSKIEQLSYEEISKVMEKSISSVESLLFRAKKNLQKLLTHYYETI